MTTTPAADLLRLKRYFTESETLTYTARAHSLTALDYYDSDQFTADELRKLNERGQPAIVINRIKPAINGIIGVTEKGRSDPRAWPRNPGDDDSADAATDVLRYIADFNRFKRTKQDCFKDMLVPGTMAALVGVDGDTQVTVTQIRWEEFFYDPRARRADFKDARYLGIAKWMYADDATALYPEKGAAIESAVNNGGAGTVSPSQSFMDRPMTGGAAGGVWVDPKMRRLLVIEMYYKDAGAWMRCVFTGSDVLEEGPSPYLDHKGRPDCPIEAHSAYVKRDNSRYGAVWDMIGPQDEINKRRSKSVHILSTSRIQVKDPSAIDVDADVARREAARPDGVIPYGWELAPNVAEFQGNIEMMAEAKSELERMGPSPAVLGRNEHDDSGRALLARQQSGLIELGNLYGALEDWELRVYRQMWARAKQFWKAPQFIRVTDDEDAPKFVGLNQPVPGGPPTVGADPATGLPTLQPGVLGYRNVVAEMDVDIEIEATNDVANIASEQFSELLTLVKMSPVYQQQAPLSMLIQLSTIPHKRGILDQLKQASDQQAQAQAQQQQIAQAAEAAKIGEIQARTQLHGAKAQESGAAGFAKVTDALTYAHATHADHIAAGLEAGVQHGQQQQAFAQSQQAQQADQMHDLHMQQTAQDAAAEQQESAAGQPDGD